MHKPHFRMTTGAVHGDCTTQIIDRWRDEVSKFDLRANSHRKTVVMHAIKH